MFKNIWCSSPFYDLGSLLYFAHFKIPAVPVACTKTFTEFGDTKEVISYICIICKKYTLCYTALVSCVGLVVEQLILTYTGIEV